MPSYSEAATDRLSCRLGIVTFERQLDGAGRLGGRVGEQKELGKMHFLAIEHGKSFFLSFSNQKPEP